MDRRWAPAAAAASVLVLVAAVTFTVTAGDDELRDLAVPPTASDSSTPDPTASPTPEPSRTARTASAAPAPTGGTTDPGPGRTPLPKAPPFTATQSAPTPAPSPSAPSPAAARAAFSFDGAYGTDEPREVIVQYGDSSSCPHEDVRHAVQESSDRVVVTLEADAMAPERACTADYRQMLVPIRLAQPLGDRILVDGSRGEPVAVDRSCQRVFANPPPPQDCEP